MLTYGALHAVSEACCPTTPTPARRLLVRIVQMLTRISGAPRDR
jgi:hypothetical protein